MDCTSVEWCGRIHNLWNFEFNSDPRDKIPCSAKFIHMTGSARQKSPVLIGATDSVRYVFVGKRLDFITCPETGDLQLCFLHFPFTFLRNGIIKSAWSHIICGNRNTFVSFFLFYFTVYVCLCELIYLYWNNTVNMNICSIWNIRLSVFVVEFHGFLNSVAPI